MKRIKTPIHAGPRLEGFLQFEFTLRSFYSLFSAVTYLQILTTNLFCGKFYKFQFLKKSLVWKFRNKIFAFKKIKH
jgi:hypothetical protein